MDPSVIARRKSQHKDAHTGPLGSSSIQIAAGEGAVPGMLHHPHCRFLFKPDTPSKKDTTRKPEKLIHAGLCKEQSESQLPTKLLGHELHCRGELGPECPCCEVFLRMGVETAHLE